MEYLFLLSTSLVKRIIIYDISDFVKRYLFLLSTTSSWIFFWRWWKQAYYDMWNSNGNHSKMCTQSVFSIVIFAMGIIPCEEQSKDYSISFSSNVKWKWTLPHKGTRRYFSVVNGRMETVFVWRKLSTWYTQRFFKFCVSKLCQRKTLHSVPMLTNNSLWLLFLFFFISLLLFFHYGMVQC